MDNAFSNPNSHVNVSVLNWLCRHINHIQHLRQTQTETEIKTDSDISQDLLELYCGNGNHTMALSRYFRRVLSVELSKVLVAAAQENLEENNIENVTVVACDR